MIVTVTAMSGGPAWAGRAAWGGTGGNRRHDCRCALGRAGITADKREGDGATPSGRFPLRRVLWRADRLPPPVTDLPRAAIGPALGWCDDPADPAYNRPIRLPHPARHERMWRDDPLYDVVIVVGHNDDPPLPGLGSAIFLHLARPDFGPTEGCVALHPDEMAALLRGAGPGAALHIQG